LLLEDVHAAAHWADRIRVALAEMMHPALAAGSQLAWTAPGGSTLEFTIA
jgi:hypothetical protein